MSIIEQALQRITEKQSKYKEINKQYWVAEQLKDIAQESEHNAELIFADLDDDKMSIAAVEKKIMDYANKNGGCCPGKVADRIIREFFGLGEAEPQTPATMKADDDVIDLADFL